MRGFSLLRAEYVRIGEFQTKLRPFSSASTYRQSRGANRKHDPFDPRLMRVTPTQQFHRVTANRPQTNQKCKVFDTQSNPILPGNYN